MQKVNIMLIDDDPRFIQELQEDLRTLFEDRFDLVEETIVEFLHPKDFTEAFAISKKHVIDLIVLEDKLATSSQDGATGVDFVKDLRKEYAMRHIPCVILADQLIQDEVLEAFEGGVSEFFAKPITPLMLMKIRNLVDNAIQYRKMRQKMLALSSGMDEAVDIVKEREREIIFRLAKAAATRDKETGNHIYRVGQYSVELSKTMGLSFNTQEILEKAAPLHDVGKIAIPDAILQKPGKLTNEEYRVMKNHTIYGYKILYNPKMDLLKIAADIALSHHERWDGKGYPFGRGGNEISLESRITTVADIFDAFTSRRRYKAAWTLDEAYQEIQNESGTSLDPTIVEALMDTKGKFEIIREQLKDED